ncbi:MAG TPA: SDR family oxidoreductase [Chthoniobacterales bacterium]
MKVHLKPLKNQVIVITGASSGIGLATARSAAAQGAKVVLASRNGSVLAEVEQQIKAAGGQAIHVVADVGHRNDVQRIAAAALEHFGGFDTWVNNAGLGIVGRIEDGTEEDFRRLFDTNFWGVVNGSLVALPHLKERGGALINLGSVASDVSLPYQGMYSTTKHAIKGFTDALRIELAEEKAPVSVTLIKPASINTPFPHHARNYTDKEPRLPPPVYAPQEVAAGILHAAVHGGRDIYIGGAGKLMSAQNKWAPALMDQVSKALIPKTFRDEPPRQPAGALHQAGIDGEVDSDHPGPVLRTSLYTRASFHPLGAALLMGVVGAVAATVLKSHGAEK